MLEAVQNMHSKHSLLFLAPFHSLIAVDEFIQFSLEHIRLRRRFVISQMHFAMIGCLTIDMSLVCVLLTQNGLYSEQMKIFFSEFLII